MANGDDRGPVFLLSQRLRRLTAADADDRRALVCGGQTRPSTGNDNADGGAPGHDGWEDIDREKVVSAVVGATPWRRAGLVSHAGLGKSTTMAFLHWRLCDPAAGDQIPFLLRLDGATGEDIAGLLKREEKRPGALLDWMAARVKLAEGRDRETDQDRIRDDLARLRRAGRISLLIDGLDHALSRPEFPATLAAVLGSPSWADCPVWVSGRPYAFGAAWDTAFGGGRGWEFLEVRPLAEADVRFYLTQQAGGDWYDTIPSGAWGLLAVPRLLALVAGIIRRELEERTGDDPAAVIRALDLGTPADVYHRACYHLGDYARPDTQGLLGQGVSGRGRGRRIGLEKGRNPSLENYPERVVRTGVLLGAAAFHLLDPDPTAPTPRPAFEGVPMADLVAGVAPILEKAGQGGKADLERDLGRLRQMNNRTLDYLLFREAGEERWAFHDPTVLAFFAASWAMKHATPGELRRIRERWVTDAEGKPLDEFDEFWRFAAQMPRARVDTGRWRAVFAPSFTPPPAPVDVSARVPWHRQMVYYSFRRMEEWFPGVIQDWRAPYSRLKEGVEAQRVPWHRRMIYLSFRRMEEWFLGVIQGLRTPNSWLKGGVKARKRICGEIEGGFQFIQAGDCPYGSERVDDPGRQRRVEAFSLHQWMVTNEMYELFDSAHRSERWDHGPHPLVVATMDEKADDRCPVVNLSWYDAWCFAAWTGHRLPTDLEWEFAFRNGKRGKWWFGENEFDLSKHAWFKDNSEKMTHVVGAKPDADLPYPNKLFDMAGNAWEWCYDLWESGSSARVFRGGGWYDTARTCRATARDWGRPGFCSRNLGFRLAMAPSDRPGNS